MKANSQQTRRAAMPIRHGLTNRIARASLAAVVGTALMCVLSASNASAQGPPPPSLPPIGGDGPAPTPPSSDGAPPTTAPAPEAPARVAPPATPPPARPVVPASPRRPVSPLRVMGSRVPRSGRTLYVNVSCGRLGTVTVSRNNRRIGHRKFGCPASGSLAVRVRLTSAAATRLRAGAIVRVTVRAGDQRQTKRMRVVRAARGSENAAGRKLARSSANRACHPSWYWTSKIALTWQASSQWAETYCGTQGGFYGTHLADWWDYYYYTARGWEYYGTWTRYHQDGCFVYWDATGGSHYGPYCPQ